MGFKWYQFFNTIAGVYLFSLSVLYMVLASDQLYDFTAFILNRAGHRNWISNKNIFTFTKFSLQYIALIPMMIIFVLLHFKKIDFLVKLSSIGVLSVLFYFIFILITFFSSLKK